MTSQGAALRRGLAAHDRALLKRLIDAEVRRRDEDDLERIADTKRRYLAEKTLEGTQVTRPAGT
jgi:hypothetical protein